MGHQLDLLTGITCVLSRFAERPEMLLKSLMSLIRTFKFFPFFFDANGCIISIGFYPAFPGGEEISMGFYPAFLSGEENTLKVV